MSEPKFSRSEARKIEEQQRLRSDQMFEVVRRQGLEELNRPATSLAWSGLAAGLAIGLSVVAQAALAHGLGGGDAVFGIVAKAGYTLGFIIVILGNLQLFTENTITPVMPICHDPSFKNFAALARIWTIVLIANFIGAVAFAGFVAATPVVPHDIYDLMLMISHHAYDAGFSATLFGGVGAGFLIAALVWILTGINNSELMVIFLLTWLIALGEFAHVIAGTVEMALLVFGGHASIGAVLQNFMLPALIGNIIGGTALFTLITYGQIKDEIS